MEIKMNIYQLAIIAAVLFSNPVFAELKCKKEWDALKNVQTQLRHKSTEWLRDKEHKKHTKYQECRKNTNKKSNSNSRAKNYGKQSIQLYKPKQLANIKKPNYSGNIKGLFTGEKQNSWIKYYKKPKDCIRPKSTQWFAKCLKHRDDEAIKFDSIWRKKNPPSTINLGKNKSHKTVLNHV
jgi:hypothetical protein